MGIGGRMDKIYLAPIIKISRTTPLAPITSITPLTSEPYYSHEQLFHLIMLLTSGVKMC